MAKTDHFKQIFELKTYYVTYYYYFVLQKIILRGVIFPEYLYQPAYVAGNTYVSVFQPVGNFPEHKWA